MASKLSSMNSPLEGAQLTQLSTLISELNPIQQAWVSGYLAAQAQFSFDALNGQGRDPLSIAASSVYKSSDRERNIVILYGSQTGNAKGVATQLQQQLQRADIPSQLESMGRFKANLLKKTDILFIVVSTYGEGEPPDDAHQLYELLKGDRAPKLPDLKFAIAALGDSSYQYFCKTGKDFEQFLLKLGATALSETVSFDVDYETLAAQWSLEMTQRLQSTQLASNVSGDPSIGHDSMVGQVYKKEHPFEATLLLNQKITSRNAIKNIHHLEFDLEDSGINYQPGDALGIWFKNDPILVDNLLTLWQLDGTTMVEGKSVRQLLLEYYELTQAYPSFIKSYADLTKQTLLQQICNDGEQLFRYSQQCQVIDVVRQYPMALEADQLTTLLRPLKPRLYSIASSQLEVEQEVHLTVNKLVYDAFDQQHVGGASGYLTDRVQVGERVKVYVVENDHFRLPKDNSKSVIMLGAGTGMAPFRSFLQQRDNEHATGKNWLFFGNTHFTQDFLYQTEIQGYLASGLLTKIDLAFSRDQAEKIYLQHRVIAQAAELYQWMQQGSYLYICGALTMAKSVEQALLEVIMTQGALSIDQAQDYLAQMRNEKRYLKDVY